MEKDEPEDHVSLPTKAPLGQSPIKPFLKCGNHRRCPRNRWTMLPKQPFGKSCERLSRLLSLRSVPPKLSVIKVLGLTKANYRLPHRILTEVCWLF